MRTHLHHSFHPDSSQQTEDHAEFHSSSHFNTGITYVKSSKFRIRLYKVIHPNEKVRLSNAFSRLDSTRFIKCGPRVRFTEDRTMHYVASNTAIPVPHLLDVFKFKCNNVTYIIQEFIDCSR